MDSKLIPWIAVTGLVLFVGGTCYRLDAVQRERDIHQANYLAALDTTRTHVADENQALSRLVEQREIEVGDLEELLDTSRDSIGALLLAIKDREIDRLVAVQAIRLQLDSVRRENLQLSVDRTAEARSGDIFRIVQLEVVDEGGHIRGDIYVTVPQDTLQAAEVEFASLTVDPFTVTYTLGCQGNNAVVTPQAPTWVEMDLDPGAVDPSVCNPPSAPPLGGLFSIRPNMTWAALGAAAGFLIGR